MRNILHIAFSVFVGLVVFFSMKTDTTTFAVDGYKAHLIEKVLQTPDATVLVDNVITDKKDGYNKLTITYLLVSDVASTPITRVIYTNAAYFGRPAWSTRLNTILTYNETGVFNQ